MQRSFADVRARAHLAFVGELMDEDHMFPPRTGSVSKGSRTIGVNYKVHARNDTMMGVPRPLGSHLPVARTSLQTWRAEGLPVLVSGMPGLAHAGGRAWFNGQRAHPHDAAQTPAGWRDQCAPYGRGPSRNVAPRTTPDAKRQS